MDITEEKLKANRENAQQSTGPKSPEGKQRSSLNATKFGLTGRTVVLPSEDLKVYEAFLQEWTDEVKPVGIKETEYLRTVVDCKWRLNRIRSAEDGLYAMGQHLYDIIDTGQPLTDSAIASAVTAEQKAKTLESISRHEARISREFSRAMQSLEETQALRKAQERATREEAIAVFKLHTMLNKPFYPQEFGFELSIIEIEAAVRRITVLDQAKIAQKANYNRNRFLEMTTAA